MKTMILCVDVCGVRIVVREWFVCPENVGMGN